MIRRFVAGGRYRHDNCIDVDIDVVKVQYRDAKRTKMRVLYINRHYQGGNMVIDPRSDAVVVWEHQYPFWRRIK